MQRQGGVNQDSSAVSAKEVTSLESLRALYLSERGRRQNVRSQLAIPVSIISFSIFGYVSFAGHFDVSKLDPLTLAMDALMILSLAFLFLAMLFLARVELTFLRVEMADLEDLSDAENEYQYFRDAYFRTRAKNAAAARHRARGFLLLLLALGCFVAAVALLPFHLRDADMDARSGGSASSSSGASSTVGREVGHASASPFGRQAVPSRHRPSAGAPGLAGGPTGLQCHLQLWSQQCRS